jgi:hypothetical protein
MFMTLNYTIEPIDKNVIIVVGFSSKWHSFFPPDDGAPASKPVGDTHQVYVYDRYCAFNWY